ncbi:MAG TPA: amidohydrolase family protein [Longimicrobiaceae bacterium]|nr:amidohydrolase family protein [Longimicrobiaceae bacterium]
MRRSLRRAAMLVLAATLAPALIGAQTRPVEGLRENNSTVHALVGGRVVIAPGRTLENATLVLRDGVIEAIGQDVQPPADARVWAMEGRTIYPGFIDPYSDAGMRAELGDSAGNGARGAAYWNPQLRSWVDATAEMAREDDRVDGLRSQGYTVVNAVPQLGMFRGSTAILSLGEGDVARRVLRSGVAQSLVLTRDEEVGTGYPTSAMGAIAFIRQTLLDADWHERAHAAYTRAPEGLSRPEATPALAALTPAARGTQPLLVEVGSEDEFLRALALADEFPLSLWLRASGREYLITDAVADAGVPLILPLGFPDAPDIEAPEDAIDLSLAELRHWHLAPENPSRLAAAGVDFSFTAHGLEDRDDFLPKLRAAVAAGLHPNDALAALTTRPAALLGIDRTHGTLERGKAANLVILDGDLFADDSEVQDVWVDGRRYQVTEPVRYDPRGTWAVSALGGDPFSGTLELTGTPERLRGTFGDGTREVALSSASYRSEPRRLRAAVPDPMGLDGTILLSGSISSSEIYGWGERPDGTRFTWRAMRQGEYTGPQTPATGLVSAPERLALPPVLPPTAYGRSQLPEQPGAVLVRNATVWTMGPQGIQENADLLIRAGRVVEVGPSLGAPAGAVVLDGTGRHVTPGLVDPHLHSGISGGVNETGSAIVPEVRVGDVVTGSSVWLYRQLAGGLTTAHLMHGSANPIGGQNQHIKLRWGALPEQLKLEGAPRTVKFALGENPTRRPERYPDTRMGVEEIIRDHFLAAREYERDWEEWDRTGRGIPPRRDLRLEAIRDILDEDILIQSHSYRQDEILMLIRLVEEFGTRVRAFHHGVEAYKVAPELARHGAAAAVWSEWGAFKIEAYDNTTYNARILHDAGVLTSLHSDDSQVATRMNWEAAKMLRTGLTPEQALALVTINPASILGVDDRIGSLEPGKDADFVIWSGDPLSTFTIAEQTWIDGRRYYDVQEDLRLRKAAETERAQLLQLIHERSEEDDDDDDDEGEDEDEDPTS